MEAAAPHAVAGQALAHDLNYYSNLNISFRSFAILTDRNRKIEIYHGRTSLLPHSLPPGTGSISY